MKSARLIEDILRRSQAIRQREDQTGIDSRAGEISEFFCARMQRLDRALAADAAARSRVEISFKTFEVDIDAFSQINTNRVRIECSCTIERSFLSSDLQATMSDLIDLLSTLKNSFGKEKTGGKFIIFAGRPHGDGDRAMRLVGEPKANLKRLLYRENVRRVFGYDTRDDTSHGGFGKCWSGIHI